MPVNPRHHVSSRSSSVERGLQCVEFRAVCGHCLGSPKRGSALGANLCVALCAALCATPALSSGGGVVFTAQYRAAEMVASPAHPGCAQLVATTDPGAFTIVDLASCGGQMARTQQDTFIVPGGFVGGTGHVLLYAGSAAPIAEVRSSVECRLIVESVATIDIDGLLTATGDFKTRSSLVLARLESGASEALLVREATAVDERTIAVPLDASLVLPSGEYRLLVESFASRVSGQGFFFGFSTFELETLVTQGNAHCPADVNADGAIDGADLGLLLLGWNDAHEAYDLSGDGLVDATDLAMLLAAWGSCAEGGGIQG